VDSKLCLETIIRSVATLISEIGVLSVDDASGYKAWVILLELLHREDEATVMHVSEIICQALKKPVSSGGQALMYLLDHLRTTYR